MHLLPVYRTMAFMAFICLLACTLVQANNLPPVAVIDLWPDKAVYYHGETIALFGESSYVQSSGYINYYRWYINGELKLHGSGAMNYDHTVVMQPGLAQQQLSIKLEVRHSNGQWDSKTITRTEKQKPGQHYYLTDHLGSVRATVNEAGTLIGWDDFYPFGMVMPGRSSNTANPNDLYKFTGHERDREAGLEIDFMNARTYDSEIGRFLQRDPHAANYPGISPYTYVANNPLIYIDPDGRDIWEINKMGEIVKHIPDETQDTFIMVESGQSITFEYGTITKTVQPSDTFIVEGEPVTIAMTLIGIEGDGNATKLFEFFSDPTNTSVEWVDVKVGNEDSGRNIVGTSHDKKSNSVGSYLFRNNYTFRQVSHNHPSGNINPSPNDLRAARVFEARFEDITQRIYVHPNNYRYYNQFGITSPSIIISPK